METSGMEWNGVCNDDDEFGEVLEYTTRIGMMGYILKGFLVRRM